MSISVSVGVMIPTNVVEVGNEITADQLSAITSALNSPSGANPFLTQTGAVNAYLPLSGGTLSGAVTVPQINNILNTDLVIDSYNDTGGGTHYLHKFTPNDGKFNLATNGGGLVFPDGSVQTVAGYPNSNPLGFTSSGISQDQAYAISLVTNVNYVGAYMSNWNGSVAYETPYFIANKGAMFRFLINNSYEFTPSWASNYWTMSNTSDDTTYNTNGTETITIKWNGANSGIPVRS